MSIALTGKSGTGKTQAALTIAKSKYKEDEIFYGRAHTDCLKELKDEHKCIILDEVNKDMFKNIDQLKGFLDNSQSTTLDVKHSSITLNNSQDKILISNSSIEDIAKHLSKDEQDIIAVLRRLKHIIVVDKPLFMIITQIKELLEKNT
jgi:DNA polymerase III delta prime subunit